MFPMRPVKAQTPVHGRQQHLSTRSAHTRYSRSRILIHSAVRPSTSVVSSSPHQLLHQTSFCKYPLRFPTASGHGGQCQHVLLSLTNTARRTDEHKVCQPARHLLIQRLGLFIPRIGLYELAASARTEDAETLSPQCVGALGEALEEEVAQRGVVGAAPMERLAFKTCGLFASARRMVDADMRMEDTGCTRVAEVERAEQAISS